MIIPFFRNGTVSTLFMAMHQFYSFIDRQVLFYFSKWTHPIMCMRMRHLPYTITEFAIKDSGILNFTVNSMEVYVGMFLYR